MHEQRNHVSCDGSPLDRAVDSNFAHHLQLLNRFDINLIAQLRVLNKSVLILYRTLKLMSYHNQIKIRIDMNSIDRAEHHIQRNCFFTVEMEKNTKKQLQLCLNNCKLRAGV